MRKRVIQESLLSRSDGNEPLVRLLPLDYTANVQGPVLGSIDAKFGERAHVTVIFESVFFQVYQFIKL